MRFEFVVLIQDTHTYVRPSAAEQQPRPATVSCKSSMNHHHDPRQFSSSSVTATDNNNISSCSSSPLSSPSTRLYHPSRPICRFLCASSEAISAELVAPCYPDLPPAGQNPQYKDKISQPDNHCQDDQASSQHQVQPQERPRLRD